MEIFQRRCQFTWYYRQSSIGNTCLAGSVRRSAITGYDSFDASMGNNANAIIYAATAVEDGVVSTTISATVH